MNNRIDRIDGNKYYEYTKVKNLNVPDADEKFSLDYRQDGLQTEMEEKKEKDKADKAQEEKQPKVQDGVRLDISNGARTAAAAASKTAVKTTSEQAVFSVSSILKSVQEFINTVVAAVKEFFYNLWNDPQPEVIDTADIEKENADVAEDILAQSADAEEMTDGAMHSDTVQAPYESESDYRMKEAVLDRKIQPYLRSGDLNQVINLLTDNGKKEAARNSTLLTYYDRNGRMVEPSASDRERILYGDRNTRKL
ncbi:MAG: hypothetical protein NC231_07045 [Bacillus sp. (in: Bacteria)]|nr:hypothetical protein [Bacillus sp. (in: firmicutes)]MCM1425928.1 hypothetical protein [Eubacterium sp.]